MYKDIEFIDGGDNGRSPIAKAVARRYLFESGIAGVAVSSSGTLVDFLDKASDEKLKDAVEPYIQTAKSLGTLTEEQIQEIRAGRNIRTILIPIIRRVSKNEADRTGEILAQKGLKQYIEPEELYHPKQTIARPDAELLFTMGLENFERVYQIYAEKRLNPRIEALGDFADPFFVTLETHRQIADEIEKATIVAVEKFY